MMKMDYTKKKGEGYTGLKFAFGGGLIVSDTDRSSTLSGHQQPDSVEDLSVLKLFKNFNNSG